MDSHNREYAAAAAAIGDQTPTGCRLPSHGDRVTYRLKGWSDRSGESFRCASLSHDAQRHAATSGALLACNGMQWHATSGALLASYPTGQQHACKRAGQQHACNGAGQ
jgi:hypothetical protein